MSRLKRFRFRLQRVLDYRETLKQNHRQELMLKNSELISSEARRDEIIAEQNSIQTSASVVMSMAEMSLAGQYQQYLQEALERQRILVIEAADAVEVARQAYVERAIEAETLVSLKDRRKQEYLDEKRHLERKELSEIVTQRYRNHRGTGQGD